MKNQMYHLIDIFCFYLTSSVKAWSEKPSVALTEE